MTQAKNKSDQRGTDQRLQDLLRGAFGGPPMPLKDIPKRNGESRGKRPIKKVQRRLRRQRKKRAA